MREEEPREHRVAVAAVFKTTPAPAHRYTWPCSQTHLALLTDTLGPAHRNPCLYSQTYLLLLTVTWPHCRHVINRNFHSSWLGHCVQMSCGNCECHLLESVLGFASGCQVLSRFPGRVILKCGPVRSGSRALSWLVFGASIACEGVMGQEDHMVSERQPHPSGGIVPGHLRDRCPQVWMRSPDQWLLFNYFLGACPCISSHSGL